MLSRSTRVLIACAWFGTVACEKKSETPGSAAQADAPVAETKVAPPPAPDPAPAGAPPSAHGSESPANPHGAMPTPAASGPPRDITPSGEITETTIAGLSLKVPKEWESQPVSGSMRLGQFALPGPGGDGELVMFRFPGGAGGVDANIERWKGQFSPPEGQSIDDVASVTSLTVGDLKITLLDVHGISQGGMGNTPPTPPQGEEHRMLAAIVEGKGDPYFLKAIGPKATMDLWVPGFKAMVDQLTAS